jgi:type VI secretion system protein ImpF
VARTLPKERLLPSLLDRLTDDDPINHSMQVQKQKIHKIEQALAKLETKGKKASAATQKQRIKLRQRLDKVRAHYAVLSASICSLQELRACVKRDLNWLLNAMQYSPPEDLENYPEIAQSVLNYGMPDLTGKTASSFDLRTMERLMKEVILNFEPRIIRCSLQIRVMLDESMFDHNALTFEIEGDLWAEPLPVHLHLRTEFELENGNVSVTDFNR